MEEGERKLEGRRRRGLSQNAVVVLKDLRKTDPTKPYARRYQNVDLLG